MNALDVLKRAKANIESELPINSFDCGEGKYCPYCSLGNAKTQLDEEAGGGLSNLNAILDVLVLGVTERECDLPLVNARNAVGEVNPPFNKKDSLAAIDKAIEFLDE